MEEENEKWKKAVVIYVIGAAPSIGTIERFIASNWNFAAKPRIFYHNEGYFVVLFHTIEDKNEVLYTGPHTIGNKPIILKSWTAEFNFYDEVLKEIPLWVSFPNLPLNCWGKITLSRIASTLGCPIYADECTSSAAKISYARVLIEMDISKELPTSVVVQDPMGKSFEQKVEYDWVPTYCQKYCTVGHDCSNMKGYGEPQDRPQGYEQQKYQRPPQKKGGQLQHTKMQKPVVQWVAKEPSKQNEGEKGNQSQQEHNDKGEKDKEAWQKASGRGSHSKQSNQQQVVRKITNGFTPLREDTMLEQNSWADKVEEQERMQENTGQEPQKITSA
ncbi:PREDICTED: uncharacterized protein LOC109232507 [Nicotiana attenuata]|uniref:uncharacterized protein LOC109232507 n=1 Tax=Nicotiana attenuata TaxID=49451 RepID=UPI0009050EB3|nr:PREDICTED: uncharacterized protein LOC109232507 [Nicotiana attenuata]